MDILYPPEGCGCVCVETIPYSTWPWILQYLALDPTVLGPGIANALVIQFRRAGRVKNARSQDWQS